MSAAPGAPSVPGQVLVTVGDIACTQTEVLVPEGRFPLRGTVWTSTNQVTVTRGVPTWAIVVAIVGFFLICLFSLFFLLAKEDKMQGFVQITARGAGVVHTTQVPVASQLAINDVENRLNYIRGLVSQLG